jgi:hypothetical protein
VSVYVLMICDRHSDPEPMVFTTAAAAIDKARETAREYARSPGDVEESEIDGWLYYASYSPESDRVWVVACEVQR